MPPSGFQKKNIEAQPLFGARLAQEREKKNISLHQVEHDTRIRHKYLLAIEEGRLDEIPPSHYKGFMRRYGAYLGLSAEDITQEIALLTPAEAKNRLTIRPLEKMTTWYITPKTLMIGLSVLAIVFFVSYVTYQVRAFASPPPLVITQPASEAIVQTEAFTIEGKTERGSSVSVDGLGVTLNADGTFTYPLILRPGLNQITIRSENRIKKQSEATISVLYQQPS